MPMIGGYTIYVAPHVPEGNGWLARAYRDSDDTHIHSAEGAPLDTALREVREAIVKDMTKCKV